MQLVYTFRVKSDENWEGSRIKSMKVYVHTMRRRQCYAGRLYVVSKIQPKQPWRVEDRIDR